MNYKVFFILLILAGIALRADAQHIQFELVNAPLHIDLEDHSPDMMAFADVDGDQDQDVLISGQGDSGWEARLYLNDGFGGFTQHTGSLIQGLVAGSIAFADVDGDQDLDLLMTGLTNWTPADRHSKLYLNDGKGNFFEVSGTPFPGVSDGAIAFADVDGDQDQDVFLTGASDAGTIAKLYTNDGVGNFTESIETPFQGVGQGGDMALADVDGDDDQDVLITGNVWIDTLGLVPTAILYLNDGNGSFVADTAESFQGVGYGAIGFADVDADQDQDVLITGDIPFVGPSAILYLNDGTGTFAEVTGTPFEGIWWGEIGFADVDGDQDQDVLITGQSSMTRLFANDGNGNFSEVPDMPFGFTHSRPFAFADVDGDADPDLLIKTTPGPLPEAKLFANDGTGTFKEVTGSYFTEAQWGHVAFADVDGDQDQDVFLTGWICPDAVAELYLNDGLGVYSLMSGTPFEGVYDGSAAFADVDGDQDSDLLITGFGDTSRLATLYLNDGNGSFSELVGTPFEGVSRSSVAFTDIDGDQDQDVLIAGWNGLEGITKLYLNDGSGTFSVMTGTPFVDVSEGKVAFADVDGDQDQDVLIMGKEAGGSNGITRLYANYGNGIFIERTNTPFSQVDDGLIAFADVDGDQDLDVFLSGWNGSENISELYLNDGQGVFSLLPGTPFLSIGSSSVAFVDMDDDQDLDMFLTGYNSDSGRISLLYDNDGFANFTQVNSGLFPAVATTSGSSLAVSDIDGDQDPDLLISGDSGSGCGISQLFRNISSTSAIPEEISAEGIRLGQNYPNPFSTQTSISFFLPKPTMVSLALFDLHGRKINQLVDRHLPAGDHGISMDRKNLPSGIYFYRLRVGLHLTSKSMIILK